MQKSYIIKILTFVSACLFVEMCFAYVRFIPYSPATPGALGVTSGGTTITRSIPSFYTISPVTYRSFPQVYGLPSEYKVVPVDGGGMYLYNKNYTRLYLFTNLALLPALKDLLRLPADAENTLRNNSDESASGEFGLMVPPIKDFLFAEYRPGYPTDLYRCRFITDYYQCSKVANSPAPVTPQSTVFKAS